MSGGMSWGSGVKSPTHELAVIIEVFWCPRVTSKSAENSVKLWSVQAGVRRGKQVGLQLGQRSRNTAAVGLSVGSSPTYRRSTAHK